MHFLVYLNFFLEFTTVIYLSNHFLFWYFPDILECIVLGDCWETPCFLRSLWKHLNINKRVMSKMLFRCLYCCLWVYFTPCICVSIVNFVQVTVSKKVFIHNTTLLSSKYVVPHLTFGYSMQTIETLKYV